MPRVLMRDVPEGPVKVFFDNLRGLHRYAGEPSTRKIAAAAGKISHSAVHSALSGHSRVPAWPIVDEIVKALGGDIDKFRDLWMRAREAEDHAAVMSSEQAPVVRPAGSADSYSHAAGLAAVPIARQPPNEERPRKEDRTDRPTMKVLIVDDHDLVRKGVRHVFGQDNNFTVVGEAATAAEAVRQAGALQPDVVIMDLRLPDGSGLEATRALRKIAPTMGIVVLTMYAGDDQLFGALEAGASAFVPKTAPGDEVVAAARHAVSAPTAFTAADLSEAMRRRLAPTGPQLSPREGQVLRLLGDGMSVAGIAKQLFVTESTAKTHIAKLYEKLGAANRAQALMIALRLGLLEAPDAPRF